LKEEEEEESRRRPFCLFFFILNFSKRWDCARARAQQSINLFCFLSLSLWKKKKIVKWIG
jgi:hypothetical protein